MINPVLSIVTGSFNRLDHLRAMVNSVRESIPPSIPYDFIIVDAGSTDGTQDWCRAHADAITLIEHGELLGAIKAFSDGARAATGDYVILANDDITFLPDSIVRALAHLEARPTCGAVAFADNRPAPGYPPGFKVQVMDAYADSDMMQPRAVVYAQVGLFRRWLGNEAGWWGDRDPIMGSGRTYGADNWLSARIWERGYSVEAVEGAQVEDHVVADSLRDLNYAAEEALGPSTYYRAYPNGPQIAPYPKLPNPQTERLRVLLLTLYEPQHGLYKTGLRDALSRVGLVYEWDYVNEPGDFAAIVDAWQPHVLLTQFHGTDGVPQELARARTFAPNAVVVNWNGDIWPEHLTAPDMLAILHHVDLQLVVNADVIDAYEREGIAAAYWQVAFEPVDEDALPDAQAHDIVFLANAYSEDRRKLGRALHKLPHNVGIYGKGWPDGSGNTLYDFAAGRALYRAAQLAISDNQYVANGFVSNRLFEALASGTCVLQQHIPGLEALTGLRAGVHYVHWTDAADLEAKIERYLADDKARQKIGAAGRRYVLEHHSFDERVKELFEVLLPMAAERKAREPA